VFEQEGLLRVGRRAAEDLIPVRKASELCDDFDVTSRVVAGEREELRILRASSSCPLDEIDELLEHVLLYGEVLDVHQRHVE
jgi:hypothetical protein